MSNDNVYNMVAGYWCFYEIAILILLYQTDRTDNLGSYDINSSCVLKIALSLVLVYIIIKTGRQNDLLHVPTIPILFVTHQHKIRPKPVIAISACLLLSFLFLDMTSLAISFNSFSKVQFSLGFSPSFFFHRESNVIKLEAE